MRHQLARHRHRMTRRRHRALLRRLRLLRSHMMHRMTRMLPLQLQQKRHPGLPMRTTLITLSLATTRL